MADLIDRAAVVALAQSCPDSHWGPWMAERIAALPAVTVRDHSERIKDALMSLSMAQDRLEAAIKEGPQIDVALEPAPQPALSPEVVTVVKRLVAVLDEHETKGPLPDTALMFCWLAAQDVRAILREGGQG